MLTRLYDVFLGAQGQLTPKSVSEFCRNSIQAFIVILVTCKNEEYPIKNEGARVLTRFSGNFFRRSRAANSAVLGGIWLKFELFQDIIDVLVTCKYEEDPIKNEGARVLTRLYDVFSGAQGQLTPKSASEFCRNSIQAFIVILVTCKNEEYPIKNEGARVLTRFSPL